jgi:hypothetical protein
MWKRGPIPSFERCFPDLSSESARQQIEHSLKRPLSAREVEELEALRLAVRQAYEREGSCDWREESQALWIRAESFASRAYLRLLLANPAAYAEVVHRSTHQPE